MTATFETSRDWRAHWAAVGARTQRTELFRQVERTIGGAPEPEDQVDLIASTIKRHLALGPDDVLLDLCCGNGLVTVRLSEACRTVVAVDYSEHLIDVARECNARPNIRYLHGSAEDAGDIAFPDGAPTKVCMNAGLQYFTEATCARFLDAVRRIPADSLSLYFTDVPDADRLRAFYNTPERWADFEHRRAAGTDAVGTWWAKDRLISLFAGAGYEANIVDIASERLTSHYRFDLFARRGADIAPI